MLHTIYTVSKTRHLPYIARLTQDLRTILLKPSVHFEVHKLATPNMFENVHLAPAGSKTVYTHVAVVKFARDDA